ncbi:hypothetical protein MPTK1_5g14240 [Marchantia polymorpha subsp. ruderalis]|nr:hypothetical protein MARPO_0032s0116 [Marchantia polymorpha]BBN11725.1 hypothetical protein Mp_5g14240 [Marchantia polymorpha subsp. ruderalis]|eukprot:PTQ41942.1 hypothetical protein MARPO_0032s0116 [Marchantia polymorpha]
MIALVSAGVVTFYSYNLLSLILEHRAAQGRRHVRFRDLATDILGPKLSYGLVYPMQFVVCLGAVISIVLVGGISAKVVYKVYYPDGDLQLYQFVVFFGAATMIMGQLPSFHSLRYVNLLSLLMCLTYSFTITGACIQLGYSDRAPPRDYSLPGSEKQQAFAAFNALALIATAYGNSIIPETQATLAPPVEGKMFKGLAMAYSVIVVTFLPVAIAGYWTFGNLSAPSVFTNFQTADGTLLVSKWLIVMPSSMCVIQLISAAIIYSQPTFDLFERKIADVDKDRFTARNGIPRVIVRVVFLALVTLIAAMFPFFGDVNAIVGSFGFTPLDFVFPMVFYILVFKPPKRSIKFWGNLIIIIVYSLVGLAGAVAAVRQLILDTSYYKLFADV